MIDWEKLEGRLLLKWPAMPPDLMENLVRFGVSVHRINLAAIENPGDPRPEIQIADVTREFLTELLSTDTRDTHGNQ